MSKCTKSPPSLDPTLLKVYGIHGCFKCVNYYIALQQQRQTCILQREGKHNAYMQHCACESPDECVAHVVAHLPRSKRRRRESHSYRSYSEGVVMRNYGQSRKLFFVAQTR